MCLLTLRLTLGKLQTDGPGSQSPKNAMNTWELGLGTLNYLPPEIRQQIYMELASICDRGEEHLEVRDRYWYPYFGRFKWENYEDPPGGSE